MPERCPPATAADLRIVARDLRPSDRCAAFIKSFELCKLKTYMPTPDDVPTIGWGSTGPDIRMGMTWTQEQADDRFAADLSRFAKRVAAALDAAPTLQREFDAMVSLAYNIGTGAFDRSSVARHHRDGNRSQAADSFLMWVKQKGRTLNGLVRRREAERKMYLGLA